MAAGAKSDCRIAGTRPAGRIARAADELVIARRTANQFVGHRGFTGSLGCLCAEEDFHLPTGGNGQFRLRVGVLDRHLDIDVDEKLDLSDIAAGDIEIGIALGDAVEAARLVARLLAILIADMIRDRAEADRAAGSSACRRVLPVFSSFSSTDFSLSSCASEPSISMTASCRPPRSRTPMYLKFMSKSDASKRLRVLDEEIGRMMPRFEIVHLFIRERDRHGDQRLHQLIVESPSEDDAAERHTAVIGQRRF